MMRGKWELAALLVLVLASPVRAGQSTVPFIGCPADGQTGPIAAPKNGSASVSIDARVATRLALYSSQNDSGVLAPRGWHCAGLYGSNGWILFVAKRQLDPVALINSDRKTVEGPAIQLSLSSGGTSGRFEVARLIARYFPERRPFLKRVIGERIEPASNFPTGAYLHDILVVRTANTVEYLTPAHTPGLGTDSWLAPSDLPIHSMAAVAGDADEPIGIHLAVRLPKDMEDLAPIILREAERQYAPAN